MHMHTGHCPSPQWFCVFFQEVYGKTGRYSSNTNAHPDTVAYSDAVADSCSNGSPDAYRGTCSYGRAYSYRGAYTFPYGRARAGTDGNPDGCAYGQSDACSHEHGDAKSYAEACGADEGAYESSDEGADQGAYEHAHEFPDTDEFAYADGSSSGTAV